MTEGSLQTQTLVYDCFFHCEDYSLHELADEGNPLALCHRPGGRYHTLILILPDASDNVLVSLQAINHIRIGG